MDLTGQAVRKDRSVRRRSNSSSTPTLRNSARIGRCLFCAYRASADEDEEDFRIQELTLVSP